MEGFLVNNSDKARYIFKRNFPVGHRIYLSDLWKMYEYKVQQDLGKVVVSEKEFVSWLETNHYMKQGFVYTPGEQAVGAASDIQEATSPEVNESGVSADGRLEKPSLSNAPPKVIEKLTYKDIAALRIADNPKKIIESITNLAKLRRAYTYIRKMPRKGHLEKILRYRIQEVERL